MLWLVMAAAATTQMSFPVSIDPKVSSFHLLYRVEDFPSYVRGENLAYTVKIRVTVDPDGSIQSCVAEQSSSNERLDAHTCALFAERAKLAPARWIDGSAAFGVIRLPIVWITSTFGPPDFSRMKRMSEADLEIGVNKLPDGKKESSVPLIIAADEAGKPVECAVNPPPSDSPYQPIPQLIPLACTQATAELTLSPPKGADGRPARSIQGVVVRFVAGQN